MNTAWLLLALYCVSQTAVVLLLKLAALRPGSFWWYFGVANVLTAVGIWLFTLVLRQMNPNVATAMGLGGTFLAGQLLLMVLFGSRLSLIQIVGVVTIFIGLMLLALAPGVTNETPDRAGAESVATRGSL